MGNDVTARTAVWKGLNRMPYIEDGELRSMKNLSSDAYPFLTTRKGREEYKITVYVPGSEGEDYECVDDFPDASEEELGNIIKLGEKFYICEYEEESERYVWSGTEEPRVAEEVTFAEYLEREGAALGDIIELGQLAGELAVLFSDTEGKTRLYYKGMLFDDINNISENSGKKLQTVGNRLIVGESGCYLYYEKTVNDEGTVTGSELKLHTSGKIFARTINASYAENAGGKYLDSYIRAYGDAYGTVIFKFVSQGGWGTGYSEVAEGLATKGTTFKVILDGTTYYLKVSSVKYEENKCIGGYSTIHNEYKYYADILTITATGMMEEYDWDCATGHTKKVTVTSADPHYFDVVPWKKRLWGYDENYVQGTVQDIFNSDGVVDWTTGDNTYTEAIAQPIWQGGSITGLAALRDALILFKEDNLTVFTGNYPAVMSGSTLACRGLSSENRESAAVANEAVYYLSEDGVYCFGGGIPVCISTDAKIRGTEAVGASDGRRYWLSLKEDDESYALYVYDIALGIWHREDDTRAVSFTMLGSKMYMATASQIFCLESPQEEVEWEAELWYDEGTYSFKKYKGFEIRGNLGECEIYLKADDGEWEAYSFTENKLSMKAAPFWCRELGIKLRGRGICEIKSLDRTYEVVG